MNINVEPVQAEEKIKPTYISKDGFEYCTPVRGLEVARFARDVGAMGGVVCGGYVRWMCSPADVPVAPSDVDVYFPSESDFEKCRARFDSLGMRIKHENVVSVTYKKPKAGEVYHGLPSIQLIKPMKEGAIVTQGGIEEILENFDFTVVRAGLCQVTSSTGSHLTAIVDADFMHDEANGILRLKNIHCPVGSTMRCMKYSKKGYWLPPTQALKLFNDWDNRPDDWRARLIEFLGKSVSGEGLSQTEIDEMEAMMRVD